MNSRSPSNSVTFLPAIWLADSSTDSRVFSIKTTLTREAKRLETLRLIGEVCLSPKTCDAALRAPQFGLPVDESGERKESVICRASQPTNSNRKERFISEFRPLLIKANTSGIGLFADQQRQQSAAADEVVMDRGAECAAGGCDAI